VLEKLVELAAEICARVSCYGYYLPRRALRIGWLKLQIRFYDLVRVVWFAYAKRVQIDYSKAPTGVRKLLCAMLVNRQARASGIPAKVVKAEWQWRVRGKVTQPQA
jgi:hypothetical protein